MARSAYFPPSLKPGGTIGVVAPGRWPKPEWIKKGKTFLEKHGYRVVIHPQNYLKDGQLAGSDKKRADAITDMFADPEIDAIICPRGGTGSIRTLDLIDYKVIARNPKPFVGFSDITFVLQAIRRKCGFVTYHGPMFWNFAQPHSPRMVEDLFTVLGSTERKHLKFSEIVCVRPGSAQGEIVGGNMTSLQNLIDTPYDWSGKGAILFIEDVDEVLYRIDRMLNHFRLAGRLAGVKAILVGDMMDVPDGETSFMRKGEHPFGKDLRQIVLDNVPPHIPVVLGFPCGHVPHLTTLPIGAHAKVKIGKRNMELNF